MYSHIMNHYCMHCILFGPFKTTYINKQKGGKVCFVFNWGGINPSRTPEEEVRANSLVLEHGWLKVTFFQKVWCVFQISKIDIPKNYPELDIWISCLLCIMDGRFKFQVQDSDLEYLFWRFDKHIALSKKKLPLTCRPAPIFTLNLLEYL